MVCHPCLAALSSCFRQVLLLEIPIPRPVSRALQLFFRGVLQLEFLASHPTLADSGCLARCPPWPLLYENLFPTLVWQTSRL